MLPNWVAEKRNTVKTENSAIRKSDVAHVDEPEIVFVGRKLVRPYVLLQLGGRAALQQVEHGRTEAPDQSGQSEQTNHLRSEVVVA